MAVVLSIISKFDDKAVTKAQKRLRDLGSGAKGFAGSTAADFIQAGATLQGVGDKMVNTGKTMTVAALPLTAAFLLSAKNAAAEAQEMALLDKAMRNATGATSDQVAAMESWITKTQNATGVADGELRPAMATLLRSTKDTTKAQDLMNQALDISAATGKPVEQVALALAKANNGNVGALGRLGLATKTASGETMTLDQVLANAASTMGGSAAAAADTAAGRAAIMQAKLADASETLGTSLIPLVETGTEVISNLADRFNNLSPATQGWIVKAGLAAIAIGPLVTGAGYLTKGLGSVMTVSGNVAMAFGKNASAAPGYARALASVAKGTVGAAKASGTYLVSLAKSGAAHAVSAAKSVVHTAALIAHKVAVLAASAASKAWAAAQWLLNAALTANPIGLIVVGIGLLVGAFILAWKHSETFRNVVTGAFNRVKAVAVAVFNAVLSFARTWGPRILAFVSNPVGAIIALWPRISSAASGAFNRVVSLARGIPGRVKSAIGNLASTLLQAGRDLIQGLINGITEKLGELGEKLRSVGQFIRDHKGPEDYDRVLLTPAGKLIMDGLMAGIASREGALGAQLRRVSGGIESSLGGAAFASGGPGGGNSGRSLVIQNVEITVHGDVRSDRDLAAIKDSTVEGFEKLARAILAV